ncbi:MAG: ArsC/Spx/MgsR family protein, partial [Myxococcota bacterium]|nr:ArsC/Spx/MgsR family protein [Myxococcota bacterium]
WEKSGLPLKKFFNTSGGSYRALDLKNTYDDYSDEERLGLLADDGMLIKRPLLDLEDTVLVGFKESAYEDALG